jgi:formylglycine-generating enzyme required for sulfatase activity
VVGGNVYGDIIVGTSASPEPPSKSAAPAQFELARRVETLQTTPAQASTAADSEVIKQLELMRSSHLGARERIAAGNSLARLGDPRFREDAWYLPNEPLLGFIEIPAGPFLMGSTNDDPQASDREKPQHELTLPRYYMARYPVTVAQYKTFVEHSGTTPADDDCLRGLPNHPVVRITWYEALTYSQWLTERLREWSGTPEPLASLLRQEGWQVTLPSEAEWEKAARGTDGRLYPWGREPDSNRANYDDTGINATSAVGCFPGGASPYGVEELSGNVWEWTRSLWGTDFLQPAFTYPYAPGDGRENQAALDRTLRVLRGGAFLNVYGAARCAHPHRDDPSGWVRYLGFRVVVRQLS